MASQKSFELILLLPSGKQKVVLFDDTTSLTSLALHVSSLIGRPLKKIMLTIQRGEGSGIRLWDAYDEAEGPEVCLISTGITDGCSILVETVKSKRLMDLDDFHASPAAAKAVKKTKMMVFRD